MYTVNLKKLKKKAHGPIYPVRGSATQHQRVVANRIARKKKLEVLAAKARAAVSRSAGE
jgi:hypothetical protein